MSTNNKVFQVLVTKGNKALAAAGTKVDALQDGQLGIFDANTNLAVDTSAPVKDFYIAIGVDTNGDGTIDNINTSAGQNIQKKYITAYTSKAYTAPKPMVIDIKGLKASPDTEYGVKLEFRNMQVYMRQGYNAFAKTFLVKTPDKETVTTLELVSKLVAEFNADISGIFTASAVIGSASLKVATAPTSAGNLTVKIGNVDITVAVLSTDTAAQTATKIAAAINASTDTTASAVATTDTVAITDIPLDSTVSVGVASTSAVVNATVANVGIAVEDVPEGIDVGVRITTNPLAIKNFADVNTMYYNPRQTVIVPSLVEGFVGVANVAIVQEAVAEEGNGYDIKQKEYHAGGWNGRPGIYRASTALGLAMPGFKYFAVEGANYAQYELVYDFFSTSGWGEYLSNLSTLVAIPTGDTTTKTAFEDAMEAILADLAL